MSRNKPNAKPISATDPAKNGTGKEGQNTNAGIIDRANARLNSGKPSMNNGTGKKCNNKNALAWHNKEADLFRMATHISQFKLAGKQITPTSYPELVVVGNRISVFEMAITPGTVLGTGDPFNKAIIDLFNRVRGKYTSTIPFQANDLGAVILAVANVISLISCVDRVLDNLGFVDFKSSLTPEILHASLVGDVNNATIKAGYDSDVFQSPNLKLALEIQIRRLQGLFMPKMSLFDFAGWIYRHVFFEDPTGVRGDMTLFRPSYIAKFNPTVAVVGATGVYASGLEYRDIYSYLVSPNPHDARIFLSAITDCIDALVQDDNVRTICGWLHQYLPDSPTIADLVQSTRTVETEMNPEMDLFISGLTFVNTSNFSGQYVQQDVTKECLYFAMTPSIPMSAVDNWMINYAKEPTDEEIGLSLIFNALTKDGHVYSDPFVATRQAIYRRTTAGAMDVGTTQRQYNSSGTSFYQVLRSHEGMNPTSIFYSLDSGGAVSSATLFADCAFQVRITPENSYNVHYASIASLMTVDGGTKSE